MQAATQTRLEAMWDSIKGNIKETWGVTVHSIEDHLNRMLEDVEHHKH